MTTRPRLLLAALLLALSPLAAQAEDRASELRYDLDEAGFRAANAEMMGRKMILSDLAVASVDGKPRIAAIWMRSAPWSGTPEAIAQAQKQVFLRQTPEEFQAGFQEMSKAGAQLAAVDAYDVGGTTYFATAYLPAGERPMQYVAGFLSADDATALREKLQGQGMDLFRLEVAAEGDGVFFFPTYILREPVTIDGVDAESEIQFNAGRVKMDFMQMQPLSISVYRGKSGHPAFSSMFDDTGSRVVILDKPVADFRKEVDPMLASGGLAFDVDSFVEDGALHYSVVLQPGS